MNLRIHVAARAAILAGKTRVGPQSVTLTDEALAPLSAEVRLEIALLVEGDPELGSLVTDPPITEPTIEAMLPALEARAASRAAITAAKRVEEARASEIAAEKSRAQVASDNQRTRALRVWVDAHGDDEQKARMKEGYLKEEEILDDICDDLLDLPGFIKYESIRRGEACDCPCAGSVGFEVRAPQYMDQFTFARLTALRENVPTGALVTPTEHRAACPSCKCVPIARIAARVTLPWNGWLLAREYLLL